MAPPNVSAAIRARLIAVSAVTALVGQRVYTTAAPPGAAMPYVVIDLPAGQMDNTTPRQAIDDVYRVHSWAEAPSTAASVHGAVYDAVHDNGLTLAGWSNYSTKCESQQKLFDNLTGTNYWHFVWDVRIRAAED